MVWSACCAPGDVHSYVGDGSGLSGRIDDDNSIALLDCVDDVRWAGLGWAENAGGCRGGNPRFLLTFLLRLYH
jgi:hypothetical protein